MRIEICINCFKTANREKIIVQCMEVADLIETDFRRIIARKFVVVSYTMGEALHSAVDGRK